MLTLHFHIGNPTEEEGVAIYSWLNGISCIILLSSIGFFFTSVLTHDQQPYMSPQWVPTHITRLSSHITTQIFGIVSCDSLRFLVWS